MADNTTESEPLDEPEDEPVNGLTAAEGRLADPVGPEAFQKHQFHLTDWLLGVTVALTVCVGIIALKADATIWTRISSQIGFLLTPFHTLLGIAIGYFFASEKKR